MPAHLGPRSHLPNIGRMTGRGMATPCHGRRVLEVRGRASRASDGSAGAIGALSAMDAAHRREGSDRQSTCEVRRGGWKIAAAARIGRASWSSFGHGDAGVISAGGGSAIKAHWADRGIAIDAGVGGIPERPEHEGPVQPPGRSPGLVSGSVDSPDPAPDPDARPLRRISRSSITSAGDEA